MMRRKLSVLVAVAWAVCVVAISLGRAAPGWREALWATLATLGTADPWRWAGFGSALAGHASGLLVFGAVLLTMAGAGAPLAGLMIPPSSEAFTPMALVLGFSTIALLQHGLGLAGLWFRPVFLAEVVVAAGGGLAVAVRARPWRSLTLPGPGEAVPAVVGACGWLAAYLLTRLPDTHEDPRTYHFAAPEQWLALHRMVVEPQNAIWHLPLPAEMAYGLAWGLGGIAAAKLVNLAAVVATAWLLPRLIAAAGGRDPVAGHWAAAAWLCAGAVLDLCWQGKNDLVLVMFVVAGLMAAVSAAPGRSRWWAAAGWCLGSAIAVKYSAVFFAAGTAVAVLLLPRPRRPARLILATGALAMVPVAGWWAADGYWLGNPFHPFASSLFPELAWNPGLQRALHAQVMSFTPAEAKSALDWIAAAFRVLSDARFGSPVLLAAVTLLGGRTVTPPVRFLLSALAVAYACWLPTDRVGRYLLPAVPVLLAVVSMAAAGSWLAPGPKTGWRTSGRWARGAAALLLLLVAGLNAAAFSVSSGVLVLTGQMETDRFLRERYTTWEDARRWVNGHVPSGARVLFTGEERRLLFQPRVVSYAGVAEPVLWRLSRDARDAAEMRKRVRQRGLSYHLHNYVSSEYRELHWYTWTTFDSRQLAVYRDFVSRYEHPVYRPPRVDHENGGFYVFEITPRPARTPAPVYFLPHTEGLFRPAGDLGTRGDLAGCIREARRAADVLHGVIQGQQSYGYILSKLDKHAEAVAVLKPGIDEGFVGDVNLETYSNSLMAVGRYGEAIRQLSRGWQVARSDNTASGLALILYQRAAGQLVPAGEYARALRDMELAVLLRPAEPAFYYSAAFALERLGRPAEALGWAKRCLEKSPGNRDVQIFIAALEADLVRLNR